MPTAPDNNIRAADRKFSGSKNVVFFFRMVFLYGGSPPNPQVLLRSKVYLNYITDLVDYYLILSKHPSKTSSQNVFLKHPPKIYFQTFLQTAYSHIIDSHITDSPPTIYFTCTARKTYKGNNSFKIQG
jgi:hypothetical protein